MKHGLYSNCIIEIELKKKLMFYLDTKGTLDLKTVTSFIPRSYLRHCPDVYG